jgi:hypothetical protein
MKKYSLLVLAGFWAFRFLRTSPKAMNAVALAHPNLPAN